MDERNLWVVAALVATAVFAGYWLGGMDAARRIPPERRPIGFGVDP